jgi:type II secretory pathway pseudopilin PulG
MLLNLTLPRLIILTLIVVIAGTTITLAFVNAKSQAKDKSVFLDIAVIQEALHLYNEENGFYPSQANGLPRGIETYINFYPKPALNGKCQETSYAYSQKLSGTEYALTFCLGHSYNNYAAGDHAASSKAIQ